MEYSNQIRIKDKRSGRFMVDDSVIDIHARVIKSHALAIYIALCRHTDNQSQQSYPSLTLLQEKLGMDRRTVILGINKLVDSKLIDKKVIPGRYTIFTLLEPKKIASKGSSKTTTGSKTPDGSSKTHREGTHIRNSAFNNSKAVDKKNGDNLGITSKATLLKSMGFNVVKGGATYEWQDTAARYAKSLGIKKPSPSWFKLFKDAFKNNQKALLMSVYSSVADTSPNDPEKYFYKMYSLKRNSL
jgi:hypothetical protein